MYPVLSYISRLSLSLSLSLNEAFRALLPFAYTQVGSTFARLSPVYRTPALVLFCFNVLIILQPLLSDSFCISFFPPPLPDRDREIERERERERERQTDRQTERKLYSKAAFCLRAVFVSRNWQRLFIAFYPEIFISAGYLSVETDFGLFTLDLLRKVFRVGDI